MNQFLVGREPWQSRRWRVPQTVVFSDGSFATANVYGQPFGVPVDSSISFLLLFTDFLPDASLASVVMVEEVDCVICDVTPPAQEAIVCSLPSFAVDAITATITQTQNFTCTGTVTSTQVGSTSGSGNWTLPVTASLGVLVPFPATSNITIPTAATAPAVVTFAGSPAVVTGDLKGNNVADGVTGALLTAGLSASPANFDLNMGGGGSPPAPGTVFIDPTPVTAQIPSIAGTVSVPTFGLATISATVMSVSMNTSGAVAQTNFGGSSPLVIGLGVFQWASPAFNISPSSQAFLTMFPSTVYTSLAVTLYRANFSYQENLFSVKDILNDPNAQGYDYLDTQVDAYFPPCGTNGFTGHKTKLHLPGPVKLSAGEGLLVTVSAGIAGATVVPFVRCRFRALSA